MEDHIRATPYGILIRHIHHCQGHHVRYCDIVKFWNYDDVILWDEVKPSCNEVLSATSIFARRTWHHEVLFHQCWFGLILTKSYKQANVLTQFLYLLALHQYSILFFCFLIFFCPTATWSTEPMWAMQSWSLTWRATILERSAFLSFLAAKSWLAKKFITVFFLQILDLSIPSIPDGSTSLWTSW